MGTFSFPYAPDSKNMAIRWDGLLNRFPRVKLFSTVVLYFPLIVYVGRLLNRPHDHFLPTLSPPNSHISTTTPLRSNFSTIHCKELTGRKTWRVSHHTPLIQHKRHCKQHKVAVVSNLQRNTWPGPQNQTPFPFAHLCRPQGAIHLDLFFLTSQVHWSSTSPPLRTYSSGLLT